MPENSTVLKKVLVSPKRWLLNLIIIQEKKTYNFNVIIIFAIFVGLMRFFMEFILAHRSIGSLNIAVLHHFTFYLHCIFIYTFILRLFVPDFQWRKSIHLILIGVFLGILPPVIDAFVYGVGNFGYSYVKNFPQGWPVFIFDKEAGLPLGESIIVFLTVFFTALVVYLKTFSLLRTIGAFIAAYLFVMLYAGILPTFTFHITEFFKLSNWLGHVDGKMALGFNGFIYPVVLSFLQVSLTIVLYFSLNPKLFMSLFFRLNHAIPFALTAMLGYTVLRPVEAYGVFVSVMVLYTFVVAIAQNDYFDKEEDALSGREMYLDRNDVAFLNVTLLFFIALFVVSGNAVGYAILLLYVVSIVYNYDFYRGKAYFPASYKIEGICGFGAFLAGVLMASCVTHFIGGDVLNVTMPGLVTATEGSIVTMARDVWTLQNIWLAFFIFGGWSVLSVIKDYKDIESDLGAGVQTAYTLLRKRNADIEKFHKRFSLLLSALMLVPLVWLNLIQADLIFSFALGLICVLFYFSIIQKPSSQTVERSIVIINIYLLLLVCANHMSH